MGVRVVDVQDVDAVDAKAFEAFFEGAHDAVVAEVEDGLEGRRIVEDALVVVLACDGLEDAPDFGGQDIIVARDVFEGQAQSGLALARPVERRGVEQVKAQCEGAVDDLGGLFVGYIAVKPADGGAAQAQAGDFEAAAAEDGFFAWVHCALPECVV